MTTAVQPRAARTQAQNAPAQGLESQILLWLLHYPLQRAGDIAAGLGVSSVTIGRLLHHLIEQNLVEQVKPSLSMQQKHAWFYLTNRGVYTAAAREGSDPVKVARAWRADETHLKRLIPRFHVLVALQNLVRDLVYKASAPLAYAGSEAEIRWRWMRDYEVRFPTNKPRSDFTGPFPENKAKKPDEKKANPSRSKRPRIVRCEADAAVVFRRMAQDELRSSYPDEEFYTLLFYLDLGATGFTERSTMHTKLRNLLLYRESYERQPYRGMFPLVVVVVESYRQMELWQQAAVDAARGLRLGSKLEGVIVNLASEERRVERRLATERKTRPGVRREEVSSIWTYNWRTLSTNLSCRLQDILTPMSYAAVPPGIFPDLVDVEAAAQKKQRTIVRGRYQERCEALSFEPSKLAKEREIAALLGLKMSDRFHELLLLLYANPLLSTQEAALFTGLSEPTAAHYLEDLQRWGCVCQVASWRKEAGKQGRRGQSREETSRFTMVQEFRWFVSERGLRHLAASQNIPISKILKPLKGKTAQKQPGKEKTYPESTPERPLPDCCEAEAAAEEEEDVNVPPLPAGNWQPGVYMLHKYLQHTAGVYRLVAAFSRAAQAQSLHRIRWFETGSRCVRRYFLSSAWHNFRPDAVLEYLVSKEDGTIAQRLLCWLEYDRGTMAASSLKEKMESYAHYTRSLEWRRFAPSGAIPLLLIVVPDRGQYDRMSRVAQEVLAESDLHVRIALQPLLDEQGILGEIWSEIVPSPLGGRTRLRRLLDMSDE